MKGKMKVYKRLNKAVEVANGSPVVQCGEFYIVGMAPFSGCSIIDPDGYSVAHITMSKLEKLGNGNWAKADSEHEGKSNLFGSGNFDRCGKWVVGENPYPYPEGLED